MAGGVERHGQQLAVLADRRNAIRATRNREYAAGGVDFTDHRVLLHVHDAKRRSRRHVGNVQQVPVTAERQAEVGLHRHDPLRRQRHFTLGLERGRVRELDHVGARALVAAAEVGGSGGHGLAVRRQRDHRPVAEVDLAERAVRVTVVQVQAHVDLVVDRIVEHPDPVRRQRRQLGDRQVFFGERRRHRAVGCTRRGDQQHRSDQGAIRHRSTASQLASCISHHDYLWHLRPTVARVGLRSGSGRPGVITGIAAAPRGGPGICDRAFSHSLPRAS